MQSSSSLIALIGISLIVIGWCTTRSDTTITSSTDMITQTNSTTLSADQQSGLLYLIEEDKLAHDVYTILYQQRWRQKFGNILQAETQHRDIVAALLPVYNIVDPTINMEVGKFKSTALQTLYNTLIAQWSQSLADAFAVGIAIEEKDIKDITNYMALFQDYPDILSILRQLKSASERHLQAFQK